MSTAETLGPLCAYGLPSALRPEVPPLDAARWRALLGAALDARAVPLLVGAVHGGWLDPTPQQRQELVGAHETSMRSCVALEAAALEVAALLAGAGVTFRLLKGAGVAHLDYPDPSWRAFGDVDLLVPSTAYDEAVAALELAGARRRSPEVRAGFDRRFGKGVCMVMPEGVQVDLHRTFVSGPFGLTIDLDGLFAAPDQVRIGGEQIPVLSRELRFLHACYHAALGDLPPRLVALRDVAQLLLATDVDVERARAVARAWHGEAVVARAVRLAWDALALDPADTPAWAVAYSPDRFEARSLAAYVGPDRSYARQMAAGVHAVRGLPAKVAYVRSLLAVDAAYARRHDGGYGHRLQRAWRARNRREQVR